VLASFNRTKADRGLSPYQAIATMGRLGPGGALLRGSRMFALPTPINPPPSDARSATATTGFPTRQTVTTTPESRKVGDWGFKHPLPLKTTTKSSTPYIRVSQVSAPESVTTFRSAADHTLTLEKFHEMKIALTLPRTKARIAAHQDPPWSAFEDVRDFTYIDRSKGDRHNADNLAKRWKFSGPWLAGMASGSFEKYLDKTVRDPKQRFRFHRYLRNILVRKLNEDLVRNNIRDGIETYPYMLLRPQDVTEDQMINYLRELRADLPLMYHHIGNFLDLAPMKPPNDRAIDGVEWSANPYALTGPPRTHPSAGISYLRSSAFMENHPLHGPQASHAPVMGRVVTPGRAGVTPRIGVGGFIVNAADYDLRIKSSAPGSDTAGIWTFDRSTRGGTKFWTVSDTATIRPSGVVQIQTRKASDEATLVARELRGEDVDALRQRLKLMTQAPIRRHNPTVTSGYIWNPRPNNNNHNNNNNNNNNNNYAV
jgi:hypothetical protein